METDPAIGGPIRDRISPWLNRYVAIAFVIQTLSYAVLVGYFEHGDVTPLVGFVRRLPDVPAALLGVFAIPAFLVTVAVGTVFESGFGLSLQTVGIGIVSETDLPFLVVAYLLSVGVTTVLRRRYSGEIASR